MPKIYKKKKGQQFFRGGLNFGEHLKKKKVAGDKMADNKIFIIFVFQISERKEKNTEFCLDFLYYC